VVLTAIMFVASQAMRKLDRQIPKALIIDEAWQMLVGGDDTILSRLMRAPAAMAPRSSPPRSR
jgi:hypothetical protein